jgi:hypothetical protein
VTDARISNRARKALMRARRKKGLHCVTIHVTNGELDRFEAAGYLDPEQRGDRGAKARSHRVLHYGAPAVTPRGNTPTLRSVTGASAKGKKRTPAPQQQYGYSIASSARAASVEF